MVNSAAGMNSDASAFMPMLCAAAVLLALSALFSVSESAFLAMNKLRLRIKCKASDKRALRVARLLKQKDELINSLLAANCLVNISLSSLAAKAAMRMWGSAGVSAAAAVTTIILLIFGEITPKTLAARHADNIAYSLSLFVLLTVTVFRPVAKAFTFAAHSILRAAGVNKGREHRSYTENDIKTVINEGASSGALNAAESGMAQGVIRFTDLEAHDIMVPRKDIIAIEQNKSTDDAIALFRAAGHSRFPVYKGTIDNITGVLYIKDLIKVQMKKAHTMATFPCPNDVLPLLAPLHGLNSQRLSCCATCAASAVAANDVLPPLSVLQRQNSQRLPCFATCAASAVAANVSGEIQQTEVASTAENGGGQYEADKTTVKDVMRPPLFILGIKKMSSVQSILQENHQSMAIVVDEYSGTDGILTINDITTRLFAPHANDIASINGKGNNAADGGDVANSSNTTTTGANAASGSKAINSSNAANVSDVVSGNGKMGATDAGAIPKGVMAELIVPGNALIKDISDRLHINLISEMNETLGGWITEHLNDLPKAGDAVEYSGYTFYVDKMDDRRVDTVRITDANSILSRGGDNFSVSRKDV